MRRFPASFAWGAAIAPYQVEGGLHASDWYQWETACPHCSHDHADDGPDFWDHYDTDFTNARALGLTTIRLGIDWSRLFPTAASFPDSPDPAAVAHYRTILQSARDHGLEPLVTLFHFALPTWIQDLSGATAAHGFEDAATVDRFAAFARYCGATFGDLVDRWLTINEPVPYVYAGWIGAIFPPGKPFAVPQAKQVLTNLAWAHARAYDALAQADTVDADGDGRPALVSYAQHSAWHETLYPDDPRWVAATKMLHYQFDTWFLEAAAHGNLDADFDYAYDSPGDEKQNPMLGNRLDFIGLNYYNLALAFPVAESNFPFIAAPTMNDLDRWGYDYPVSDFGWALYPEGMRKVLDELRPYGLPIYVTENGVADGADTLRPKYLVDQLDVLAQAIADGIDVRGYYEWSLIDNFEWASGYCPKFGLYRVDDASPDKPRTPGAGASAYRAIIANGIDDAVRAAWPSYGVSQTACKRLGF